MMPIWLFFADACNESDDLRQELVRIEGQKNEAEATMASLAVDVATHRATQQRLEVTIVRLQNEAAGEHFYRATPFCFLLAGLHK